MTNIYINDIVYDYVIDTNFGEIKTVSTPEWINQNPEIDTNIWTKKPLIIVYTLRVTDAEKWALDQLLTAHQQVFIEDDTYSIYASVWVRNINSTWAGNENYSNPWLLEIELVVISLLEGDYSNWAIYDSFDDALASANWYQQYAIVNRIETTILFIGSNTGEVKKYTISSKTLSGVIGGVTPSQRSYEPYPNSAYGTYVIVFTSDTHISIFKNGVLIQTLTDTDLGLDYIASVNISAKGKYIVVSGRITTSGNYGWVILVGS